MKRDSRLSGVLHVLLHMGQKDGPVTSEVLAKAMDTNPVVLRRALAGLREQGYVRSEKGHGGGWTLACDLAKVTMRDIYTALGSPALLAMENRTEMPGCVVEEAVNAALRKTFEDAEALLLSRLNEVTLATLSEDVRSRLATRGRASHSGTGHRELETPKQEPPATEFWETAFLRMQLAWGLEPTASASLAGDYFSRVNAKDVLIPGIGYGRNAKPFLERGMSVTGIEISETAIALARSRLGLEVPIVHGSVTDMPFDRRQYDGIFCYGLVYLLDASGREKFIRDCYRQLAPGGHMIFTVISKKAPMYGQGPRLGDDWYERLPNLKMYFYDADSVKREFGPYGLLQLSEIDEPSGEGVSLPFINVICKGRRGDRR